MRISDWSSDVCSSDLRDDAFEGRQRDEPPGQRAGVAVQLLPGDGEILARVHSVSHSFRGHSFRGTNDDATPAEARRAILEIRLALRSEEHTSELQSLMRISYAVFCLKKKNSYTI